MSKAIVLNTKFENSGELVFAAAVFDLKDDKYDFTYKYKLCLLISS